MEGDRLGMEECITSALKCHRKQPLKLHEYQINNENPSGMWFLSLTFAYRWNMLKVTGTPYKLAHRSNPDTRRMVILCKLPEDTQLLKTVRSLMIGPMGSYHDIRTAQLRCPCMMFEASSMV